MIDRRFGCIFGSSVLPALFTAFGVMLIPISGLAQAPKARARIPNTQNQILSRSAVLTVRDSTHGKFYTATDKYIESLPGKHRYVYGPNDELPEAILPSSNGRALIVRTIDHSYSLNTRDMTLLRRFPDAYAWWERNSVAYLGGDSESVHLPGRRRRVKLKGAELISVDESGKYFLAMRKTGPGNSQDGNVPTYRFYLCYRVGASIGIRRKLLIISYDPGSQGGAKHLAAIGSKTALFGIPEPAALVSDFVGVLRNGRVTGPIKDGHRHPLQFAQPPIIVADSIVALADAVNSEYKPVGRYIVAVSKTRLRVKSIGNNAAFITYDKSLRQVGVGTAGKGEVTITWKSVRESLR